MTEFLNKHILKKLLENVNYSKKRGMIIASPSNDPPYKFHWVRDASIVMRVLIDCYLTTKEDKYFPYIINYLENTACIQNLDTLTGLGEPKINIDRTPYNEPWGRPQNDGPGLRGLNMLKLYQLLKTDYPNLTRNLILSILQKDIQYVLENYNKICFDLWEEIQGWHFYTRLVQLKFLKEYLKHKDELDNFIDLKGDIEEIYFKLRTSILDHIGNNEIISSFSQDGKIIRLDDASILLGFCHIDFDDEYVNLFTFDRINKTGDNLLQYFREKYQLEDFNMIGRYKNDAYYGGQSWIICSLALSQFYYQYSKKNKNSKLFRLSHQILDYIVSIDINLDLAEQYNPNTDEMLSAEKLTWNYSELYFTNKNFNI
jgi:glucoamylase